MRYRHAILVAFSPLLGVASAALLTQSYADATNVQGGGGLANTAGVLSMIWGYAGWYLTLPLAAVIAAITWVQRVRRRAYLEYVNGLLAEDPPKGLTQAEIAFWLMEQGRRDRDGSTAPPAV
jgi:hypothetical protein